MEQTTYVARLRYLDTHDLDTTVVDFTDLDVRGTDNSTLGALDGFLVDATSGRVLYTVVDSKGWFRSRRVLIPVGHATVDRQKGALCLDVPRDTLRNYPAFDESRFREFSDADLKAYERKMTEACCPDDTVENDEAPRRHFTQPGWWTAGAYGVERLRAVESRPYRHE